MVGGEEKGEKGRERERGVLLSMSGYIAVFWDNYPTASAVRSAGRRDEMRPAFIESSVL